MNKNNNNNNPPKVHVGEKVGSGAHGTVHICSLEGQQVIGKRAWTKEEFEATSPSKRKRIIKKKAKLCEQYMRVEEHCFQKLGGNSPQLPIYKGTYLDKKYRPWMLFDLPSIVVAAEQQKKQKQTQSNNIAAPSLADLMKKDHNSNSNNNNNTSLHSEQQHGDDDEDHHHHHLHALQKALGVEESSVGVVDDSSMGETLDVFFDSLLSVLTFIHSKQIIHRDVKPDNLLVTEGSVSLIDFGSAVDLDLKPMRKLINRLAGVDSGRLAPVSPIYSPPEMFVDHAMQPMTFDVFSAAFIYCQLLFNFLDETSGAMFHEDLASSGWDLEVWLEEEMSSSLSSSKNNNNYEQALRVLAERRGLFRLLSDMLKENPSNRIRSDQALDRFRDVLVGNAVRADGLILELILEAAGIESVQVDPPHPRPLHFSCTFYRNEPLGLVLKEARATGVVNGMDNGSIKMWLDATINASPHQMFVRDVVEGGQADQFEIFEIGDRFQGVGELPFGFAEKDGSVELPPSDFVTLHFDRKKLISGNVVSETSKSLFPVDHGVWAAQGERDYQEDNFIFHQFVSPVNDQSILVAGVFDGHGGDEASKMAATMLPGVFSNYLFRDNLRRVTVSLALEKAWETVCDTYRDSVGWRQEDEEEDGGVEEYDPAREMMMMYGEEQVEEAVAGTTSSIVALDESNGEISILNCGDSRSLVIDDDGWIVFETGDHSPQYEIDRLQEGIEQGLDYSLPEQTPYGWYLPVGDYEYALSRSLEGPFATSKGIISTPDMTTLQGKPGMTIVIASDGLFEDMDSNEIADHALSIRHSGKSAGDAAKVLCAMALRKGSCDNISVLVVYL